MYWCITWCSLSRPSTTDVIALYLVLSSEIGRWSLAWGFSFVRIITHFTSTNQSGSGMSLLVIVLTVSASPLCVVDSVLSQ